MAEKSAATLGALQMLHGLVADSMIKRLEEDLKDGIPTDAATLGAITKFLKDNEVTADPADADDLSSLRDKLKAQSAARKQKVGNVIQLASTDLDYKEA